MPPVNHRARQLHKRDFTEFEYILCMDESNLSDIHDVKPKNSTAVIDLLGNFDPEGANIIEDPYYGGESGFQFNYEQITRCAHALIDKVHNQ
jgi:low molecular weight phosphotyrosine protein phosphatase